MNRAVLPFSQEELQTIYYAIGERDGLNPLLKSKLETGIQMNTETSLELTEDDFELILDEFIIPSPEDTDAIKSIRKKVQQKLLDFRSQ